MALEGSLTDFGLADILQLIYFQRKTGILKLEGRGDKVSLMFIDGNIGGAESKRRMEDNRLGKILLKKEHIKEKELETALEEQRKTGVHLGNILIRNSLVNKEIIQDIVQGQITETIIQLFGWKHGTYEFAAQKVSQDKELPFLLDTQHLLMEGLRIVDEWSVIQGKITLDSVFKRTDTTAELTKNETAIYAYVDGENDVSTIIDLSGQDNFEVSKTLLSLLEKGFIETVEIAPVIIMQDIASVKAPSLNIFGYLPYLAIILSLCFSLAGLFIQQNGYFENFSASKKIDALRVKVEIFKLEHDAYPPTLDQIAQTKDLWGRPYIYRTNKDFFYISSAGADGIEGTKDDIY